MSCIVKETESRLTEIGTSRGVRPSCVASGSMSLVNCLNDIIQDKLKKNFTLVSLDPGMGKTTTILAFLECLFLNPEYQSVGVLVCFSRIEEIKSFMATLNVPCAVWTSEEHLRSTPEEISSSQILLVTQRRLEIECENRAFRQTESLFYKGAPRVLKVWDESFHLNKEVCVVRDKIMGCFQNMRRHYPEQTETMEGFMIELNSRGNGDKVLVPDFSSMFGSPLLDVIHDSRISQENRELLKDLQSISMKTALVRRPQKDESIHLLSYERRLPEDIAPLVILDASGRVRSIYQAITKRGDLQRIEGQRTYSSLTVHLHHHGSGREAMEKHQGKFLNWVASVIEKEPHHKWLIVHRKANEKLKSVPDELFKLVSPTAFANTKFLSWGCHTATNEFRDCTRIIVLGLLYLPPYALEAKAMAAFEQADRELGKESLNLFQKGEIKHDLLQAICRSALRETDTEVECKAYIIAAKAYLKDADLREVFPGCEVRSWTPEEKPITGRAKMVLDKILSELREPGSRIRNRAIYTSLNMKRQEFDKLVSAQHLLAALATRGVRRWKSSGRNCGFEAERVSYLTHKWTELQHEQQQTHL